MMGVILTTFYIVLYWYPEYLGLKTGKQYGNCWFFDPLSYILNGTASQWFVYGTLYTIAIVGLGYVYFKIP
jgi:hypothetical protein